MRAGHLTADWPWVEGLVMVVVTENDWAAGATNGVRQSPGLRAAGRELLQVV